MTHHVVDRRLESHDANQLELKLGYRVDPGSRRQRYRAEMYIFVPRTLAITRDSYPSARFYQDTATFIRLKTPKVAVAGLAQEGNGSSRWFDPLQRELDAMLAGSARGGSTQAVRLIKLLGCVYRRALLDDAADLRARFDSTSGDMGPPQQREAARALEQFRVEVGRALTRLRELGARCEHAAVPERVREVWRTVDEYVSLLAEQALTSLVALVERRAPRDSRAVELQTTRDLVAADAVAQYEFRRERSYPSWVETTGDNELLPYRRRLLKRIVCSLLYLDVRREESGAIIRNMAAMTAAGVAMLFATVAAIAAQNVWGATLSSAFIGAMVVSYIIKDRIKDWGKALLASRAGRTLPDHALHIRCSDTGDALGRCSESMTVLEPSEIAPEIRELRHFDHPSAAAADGRPETVIRYVKDVRLSSAALAARTEADGLTDIIRFSVAHLRSRMDDPEEDWLHVHPDTRELVSVRCARVYHLNVVLRLTTGTGRDKHTELERIRVVLDRRGIKRVEPIRLRAEGVPASVRAPADRSPMELSGAVADAAT